MHTGSLDLLEADRLELAADTISARADTENFPVALRILSAEQRRHLMAIYRFARLTDQIGDAARGDRLALLDELQRQLDRCAASEPDGISGGDSASDARALHPVIELLAPTIRACSLPIAPFHRLIDANRLDQRKRRCESYRELLDYCALSANPVGELVLHVFGAATPERIRQSDAVCSGLQLVEHWQDVREDYTAGRIYIPSEDLAKFGCSEADLGAERASPALRELLRFECERAHGLLDEGVPLVRSLRGRARLAIAGFVAGGRAALDAIARASYDVMSGAPRATRRDFARRYLALLLAPARSGRRA